MVGETEAQRTYTQTVPPPDSQAPFRELLPFANGPSGCTLSLDVSTVISGENTNPPQPHRGSESFWAAPSTSARPALVTPSNNLERQVFRRPDLGGGDPRGCGKGGLLSRKAQRAGVPLGERRPLPPPTPAPYKHCDVTSRKQMHTLSLSGKYLRKLYDS